MGLVANENEGKNTAILARFYLLFDYLMLQSKETKKVSLGLASKSLIPHIND